jgi:uncharacterized protein YoxC
MTTDERLDRLAERHGALGESLQLLTADVQGLAAKQGALTDSLQLLTADVQSLAESVKELRELGKDHDRILRGPADLIGDLVKIATAHEPRIDRVERHQG